MPNNGELLAEFLRGWRTAEVTGNSYANADMSGETAAGISLYYQAQAGGAQTVLHIRPIMLDGKPVIRLVKETKDRP